MRDGADGPHFILGGRAHGPEVRREDFKFEQVPFAHPLWILFSSGTTGLPKPIIHSHGGMTLEQCKA